MGAASSKSKKGKRPDTRPARGNYWSSGNLCINKVRRMVKSRGMSVGDAYREWDQSRKRHRDKMKMPTLAKVKREIGHE